MLGCGLVLRGRQLGHEAVTPEVAQQVVSAVPERRSVEHLTLFRRLARHEVAEVSRRPADAARQPGLRRHPLSARLHQQRDELARAADLAL